MSFTRQTLRVYATLTSLKERTEEDVLDALIPFLLPILNVFREKKFAPQLLVIGTKKLYGWNITTQIAEAFRERLIEKNYLRAEGSARDRSWICTLPDGYDSVASDNNYEERLWLVVDEFAAFCEQKQDLFSVTKTKEDLQEILIKFLVSLDAYSKEAIHLEVTNIHRNDPLRNALDELPEGASSIDSNDRYLCARFVKFLYDKNSASLDYLGAIASVGLVTEVVQDFIKPVSIVSSAALTIFLDAPLAMELLGLAGPDAKAEADTIYQSLKSIGCQFAVFPVSCREITRVLTALIVTPRGERFGLTHDAMISGRVTDDFVRYVRDDPENALRKIGIATRQISTDDYPNLHHHFPKELYNDFIPEIRWHSDDARAHDAECLTLVMRLREGLNRRDPLQNKVTFATSNRTFARKARDYCINRGKLDSKYCSPVIHQTDLATAAWLRTGFGASANVPRGHLVKVCGQILTVKKDVIDRARSIIRDSDPEKLQQFDLLMQDRRAVTRVMDRAHGPSDGFSDANADRLLNDMLRATTESIEQDYERQMRELQAKQDRTRRDLRARQKAELAERDTVIQRERAAREAAEQAADSARIKLELIAAKEVAERAAELQGIASAVAATNRNIKILEKMMRFTMCMLLLLCIADQVVAATTIQHPMPSLRYFSLILACLSAYYVYKDFHGGVKFGFRSLALFVGSRILKSQLAKHGVNTHKNRDILIFNGSEYHIAVSDG